MRAHSSLQGVKDSPDLLNSLDIFSELGVEIGGGHLADFLVLEVGSSVQEPGWDSVGNWVGDHISDLGDLFLSELSSSGVDWDAGLVAENDGESSSDTSDASEGERSLSLSIEIGVQDSQNELEGAGVFHVE